MPGNLKKEDLRILKTHKALMNSMTKLLELRNFAQITVNDLCEEAQISRATFYSHFEDKYDLLRYWLAKMKSMNIWKSDTYEDIETSINDFLYNNLKIIKNLIEDANSETSELLCDFMFSLLEADIGKTDDTAMNSNYIVLSKFCSGGIMHYLKWQIKNNFPATLKIMNPYFYDILKNLLKWNTE